MGRFIHNTLKPSHDLVEITSFRLLISDRPGLVPRDSLPRKPQSQWPPFSRRAQLQVDEAKGRRRGSCWEGAEITQAEHPVPKRLGPALVGICILQIQKATSEAYWHGAETAPEIGKHGPEGAVWCCMVNAQ